MKQEDPFPVYETLITEICANPEEVIRQRRTEQIVALKLLLPDEIRARRRMRRIEYEKFETCMRDIEALRKTIELAVKSERDSNNKLCYPNKETRAVEIQNRLESDPVFLQRERMRRAMYSQSKSMDEEIERLEKYDQSLIEIIALCTATLEYHTRGGDYASKRSTNRASKRNKASAAMAAGSSQDALGLT